MTLRLKGDQSLDLFVGAEGAEIRGFPEDVADEVKWRVRVHKGDIPRDKTLGVDYGTGTSGVVFNPVVGDALSVQEIRANGVQPVAGVVGVREPTFRRDGLLGERLVIDFEIEAEEGLRREIIEQEVVIDG